MATVTTIVEERFIPTVGGPSPRAVSWGAIIAGAAGAAALSLILVVLGTGLGLASISPWARTSASAEVVSWSAVAWMGFTALAASGLGGYLAGRLRDRWPGTQRDEVYFRDTAHGFLAWAVATIVTAATLTSAIGSILGTAAPVAAVAGAAATSSRMPQQAEDAPNSGYAVDQLFRAPANAPVNAAADPRAAGTVAADDPRSREEVGRIFDTSLKSSSLSADDARYVGQILAQHRGYAQPDAEQRVRDTFNSTISEREKARENARQLAEQARKNAAKGSLWLFASLLLGAFFASLMATFGGRQRDLP